MHIATIHVTPIAITDPPLLNAAGLHAPYALRTILEIVTDDGVSGLGEVPGSAETTAAVRKAPQKSSSVMTPSNSTRSTRPCSRSSAPTTRRATLSRGNTAVSFTSSAPSRSPASTSWAKRRAAPCVICSAGVVRDRVDFSAYLFYKYEGAGGELGFDTDPDAVGWPAARRARRARPGRDCRAGTGHVRRVRLQVHQAQGGCLPAR